MATNKLLKLIIKKGILIQQFFCGIYLSSKNKLIILSLLELQRSSGWFGDTLIVVVVFDGGGPRVLHYVARFRAIF